MQARAGVFYNPKTHSGFFPPCSGALEIRVHGPVAGTIPAPGLKVKSPREGLPLLWPVLQGATSPKPLASLPRNGGAVLAVEIQAAKAAQAVCSSSSPGGFSSSPFSSVSPPFP